MPHHPKGTPPRNNAEPGNSPEPRPDIGAEEVADYLRAHPDFLVRRAELAGLLAPPVRDMGAGVVDLQSFIVERLRDEVAQLKLAQRKLISTSRNNMATQTRVHLAILALLKATSFDQLINTITEDLAWLLNVDAVGLCVERVSGDTVALPSANWTLHVLERGEIDQLLGANRDVLLRADISGDARLFGANCAGLVRSDALIRLHIGQTAPACLLCLGARRPNLFHAGQATDLLCFLARIIEYTIRAWLNLPDEQP